MATWLVTGANRGIGLEMARQLAERGDRVIATARSPGEAPELAALDARVEPLDVASDESVAALARRLDGVAIDALVNNAGIMGSRQDLERLDIGLVTRCFEVNALGALRVTRALLPHLRAGGRKLVANVTSKMGSIDDNTSGGSYAYRTSKTALNMITRSLAVDLAGEGFVALVVHPGWVRTDMGGASAPVSVAESVAGLLAILDRAGPEESGSFFDFRGDRVAW